MGALLTCCLPLCEESAVLGVVKLCTLVPCCWGAGTAGRGAVQPGLTSQPAVLRRIGMRQWTHLEQQSFPMSEPEYMEKLNNIAFYLGYAACAAHAPAGM